MTLKGIDNIILDAWEKRDLLPNIQVRLNYVADDYAIDFGYWIVDNTLRVDLDGYKTFGDTSETKPHTMKDLLEIFKKEKGL